MTTELREIRDQYESKLMQYKSKVEEMEKSNEEVRREAARERESKESILSEMAVRKRVEDELQETLSQQGREFKKAVEEQKKFKRLYERALRVKKGVNTTIEGLVSCVS